jgi:16S rRNA (cytidine1402-2'-O)-methyltransferase
MPIGNAQDISLRALEKLKKTDLLICEDRKTTAVYFRQWGIPFPSDRYVLLNEHTSKEELNDLLSQIKSSKDAVLVSDSGMPVFCDPGASLIKLLNKQKADICVIPGPTALTTAISLSGIGGHGFLFAGFPPQKTEERIIFYQEIFSEKIPVAFYDTPYRLKKVMEELSQLLPTGKKVFVASGLTTENEFKAHLHSGQLKTFNIKNLKKEPPVFIIYDEHLSP